MPSSEKRPAKSEPAHDLYLKGVYAAQKETKEALEEGIRHFETAIERDPEFSLPHSACANTLLIMGGAHTPYAKIGSKARELVGKALQLDPDSSDAHMAAGNLAFQLDLDWNRAEGEFQKSLSLNPGNFYAHFWSGVVHGTNQRFDEARHEYREAIRLNPSAERPWMHLAMTEYNAGDIYTATTLAEELVERNPTSVFNRLTLAYCYEAEGRTTDVLKELDKLPVLTDLNSRVSRAGLSALAGRTDEARSLLRELEERSKTTFVPPIFVAQLYGALGDKTKALEVLERDFREGDHTLWYSYQGPEFRSIRNEPRFVELLKSYNLPPVKEQRPLEARGPVGPQPRTSVPVR